MMTTHRPHRARRTTIRPAQAAQIQAQAESLAAQVSTLEEQARELAAQLKLARGTRDDVIPGPTPDDPRSTAELFAMVEALLRERPLRHPEIVEAIGGNVNPNRIKGVITQLGKSYKEMVNLGTPSKAIWFLPDPDVLARLERMIKGR